MAKKKATCACKFTNGGPCQAECAWGKHCLRAHEPYGCDWRKKR